MSEQEVKQSLNVIQEEERIKEIQENIEYELKKLTNIEPLHLHFIPNTLIVPVLQKLRSAPYKLFKEFKKYYIPELNAIVLKEINSKDNMIMYITEHDTELYFISRTSKKLYHYILTQNDIDRIMPKNLSFYSTNDAENVYLSEKAKQYWDPIIGEFYSVQLIMTPTIFEVKDNIYIVKIAEEKNIEIWGDKSEFLSFINAYALRLTKDIYYFKTTTEHRVMDNEFLMPGSYLIYMK